MGAEVANPNAGNMICARHCARRVATGVSAAAEIQSGKSSASKRCCAGSTRPRGEISPAVFIPIAEETGRDPADRRLGAEDGLREAATWNATV